MSQNTKEITPVYVYTPRISIIIIQFLRSFSLHSFKYKSAWEVITELERCLCIKNLKVCENAAISVVFQFYTPVLNAFSFIV
jgi:hypothetical protein